MSEHDISNAERTYQTSESSKSREQIRRCIPLLVHAIKYEHEAGNMAEKARHPMGQGTQTVALRDLFCFDRDASTSKGSAGRGEGAFEKMLARDAFSGLYDGMQHRLGF